MVATALVLYRTDCGLGKRTLDLPLMCRALVRVTYVAIVQSVLV